MNYSNIRTNSKQFKALTSMSAEGFDLLLPRFEADRGVGPWENYIERYTLSDKPRASKYSSKVKQDLTTSAEKLFFVPYALKNNPLQEALTASFSLQQEMAQQWFHLLESLLKKALKAFAPQRNSVKLNEQLQIDQTYLLDATEPPIPRATYQQEKFYSNKNKTHILKNLLLLSLAESIFFSPSLCRASGPTRL